MIKREIEEIKSDNSNSIIELQKLEIESQKLEIEKQKLKIEKSKLIWTSLASIIPLFGIIATIFYGIYSQRQNEKNMFQIKAAEILFNSADGYEVKENAQILKKLFPGKLPSDFGDSFEPNPYDSYEVNTKKDLIKLLTSDQEKNNEIIKNWKKVFPEDRWVDTLITKK